MSRQLRDWAILGSAANTTVVLRVFDYKGALAGSFTVTPGTSAVLLKNAAWSGTGWSDNFMAAEVISIANGSVYAAPVASLPVLTSSTGATLAPNFNLGELPLAKGSDPKPVF